MILSDDEFNEYAINNYRNPNCISVLEYLEDLNKIKYIKRLINKYVEKGELRERLILNHIIVLYNIFGDAATKLLFYKIEQTCWDSLITFLVYLDRMPETLPEYGIVLSDVVLDEKIIAILRKI